MGLPREINPISSLLTAASVAIVIGALYLGKGLLVPLTMAVLLSFLLSPICNWLERHGLGRFPSVLVTAIVGFTLLGGLIWTAFGQIASLAPKIPEYQANVEAKLGSVNTYAVLALRRVTRAANAMGEKFTAGVPLGVEGSGVQGDGAVPVAVRVISDPSSPLEIVVGMSGSFGTLLQVLGAVAIVIVLVVFFLVQREDLRDRFIRLIGKTRVTLTTQTLEDAGKRVTRYLTILFLLNLIFGISIGLGLYWIGLPNAILWGIMAGLLRFIPYLGPWIAAAMPVALSMAISPGWMAPLLTVGLFVVLELLNNNLLEPWLYGKNTGVSSVAVLVAAFFWMWLWGPIGILLATPLTVCMLVVGRHVPELAFLGTLLGSDPVFEPYERVYQRLLVGGSDDALDLFESFRDRQGLAEVYDAIMIPALRLAETQWSLGELSDARHDFAIASLREMVQLQGEERKETRLGSQLPLESPSGNEALKGNDSERPRPSVLCLPARNETDGIASQMLAQVLSSLGCAVETVTLEDLHGDAGGISGMRGLEARCADVDLVCISAMSPAAVMHARHVCKRLSPLHPNVRILVGLWGFRGDVSKALVRIGCEATVVTSMHSAGDYVVGLAGLDLRSPIVWKSASKTAGH